MTSNSRIEGTLATLRQEWNDTQARLRAIEDAIRAVQRLIETPTSTLVIGPFVSSGITIGDHLPDITGSRPPGNVFSVPVTPPPPPRRLARRPPLKVSILELLKERPAMWTLESLAMAMHEQGLVGGASEKTIKETVRQTANKMAAEGEIRRRGREYGWPPGWEPEVSEQMATFLDELVERADALNDQQPVGERLGS